MSLPFIVRRATITLTTAMILAFSPRLGATTYSYTKILDGFNEYTGVGTPSIAPDGTVAVRAVQNGVDGLRSGTGGAITTLSDVNGPFSQYSAALNALNGGGANFFAVPDVGGQGIYSGFGGSVTTIVDDAGAFASFLTPFGSNVNGVVAFRASTDGGQVGIYRSNGMTTTTIIDSVGAPGVILSATAGISDNGVVVFYATQSGVASIRTGTGGPVSTVWDNSGPLNLFTGQPQINNGGKIIFYATLDAGGSGVFTTDGVTLTTIATTDGELNNLTDVNLSIPSINNTGQIAFWAKLDDGSTGMFTGGNFTADKVIRSGDALDGSTVSSVRHGRGISPSGAVCFQAILATGHTNIYRADPVVAIVLGDMNCDGVVNLADVAPFALALVDPVAFGAAFPNCDRTIHGDLTGDSVLDGRDVPGFVALLSP